ncbi:MAG: autotransporter-associated N-terminal domain-containing protein, partial [Fusobacterium sp.]|nr:autotransporter-associated N-terminal domain-containing protein [Fusobacterium sp.]
MNSNNLDNIKRNIRNLAKRCRGISYSTALVVLYAMLGINAFAEDVVTQGMEDTASKAQISTSADKLSQVLKDIKAENEKKLKNANLELVQLMEQGDQVVKSPWSSWQFGVNYYYDNFRGSYKGRGDKNQKYPYEGIFARSNDIFEKSTSPDSSNYSKLRTSTDSKSGITSLRKGLSTEYGLISVKKVKEPISSFDVTASINPRNITKGKIEIPEKTVKEPVVPEAIAFEVPSIKVTQPAVPQIQSNIPAINAPTVPTKSVATPKLPETIEFNKPEVKIAAIEKLTIESRIPEINIGAVQEKTVDTPILPKTISFNPIAPNVELPKDPSLPEPPTFAIVLGADCNTGCNSSSATPRLNPNSNFNLNGRAEGNTPSILHYTWNDSDVPNPAARALAFKMYAESSTRPFTLGEGAPLVGGVTPDQREYYFNSYNFGDEYSNIADSNYSGKNNQYFFVGGSRFIENDNGSGAIMIPEGFKLNLGGIFTLGLVSQGYQTLQKNAGTITDQKEKDDKYIKDMPYDHGQDYKLIKGPTEDYKIKRSADGYVGYKVGIALVQEDAVDGGKILNSDEGVIDFRGERSIGLYTYLPRQQSNREMINEGAINLSGKESYGMKYAATEKVNGNLRPKLVNEATGVINLRKNPDGVDKADNSAAMALMKDESITSGVTLSRDQAKNKGTISLTDVENSLGMFVNINSNMTNEGKIAVNSKIETTTGNNQAVNVAMRADNSGAEVINEAAGTISTDGAYVIGMLANKNAKAVNKGKIESTAISHGTGLMAMDNSILTNSGSITLKGDDNIGVYLKSSKSEDNKFEADSVISITGNKSTGVLVADS